MRVDANISKGRHSLLQLARGVVGFGLLTMLALPGAAPAAPNVEVSTVFDYGKDDPYDRTNLYGFNHAPNVTVLPDGTLQAAWFSGPFEGSVHQVILGSTSRDGGKNWSEPSILFDTPKTSDYDPAFIIDGQSVWLFFAAGRWDRYPFVGLKEVEKKVVGLDSYRIYAMQSQDSGKTWSAPAKTVDETLFSRNNGIVLKGGQMLLPVYDSIKGKWAGAVLRSDDRGATWKKMSPILAAKGLAGGEPTIAELDNGDVLIALRSRDGHIWFAQSSDAGATWKEPFASDFEAAGSSHGLFRSKSGRILLTYNACKPPLRSPLVLRLLDQQTMKWSEPLRIAEVEDPKEPFWSRQVSYPSIAELPDGTFVVVWTEVAMSPDIQYGKIRCARIQL